MVAKSIGRKRDTGATVVEPLRRFEMRGTPKKKSNHTELQIMAPRDSHAERERIEAKLQELQEHIIKAKLQQHIKAGMTKLEQLQICVNSLAIAAEETKEIAQVSLAIRAAWPEVADTVADSVSAMCQARDVFHRLMDELGIENILIEHVPLNQRWLLERWFSAIRATDKGIDELAGMVPDMEPHPGEKRKEVVA
jgi:hypothetical protein